MSERDDPKAVYNENLVKELFKPWIHALKTTPIEDVLADPSLRKRRRKSRKAKVEDSCIKTT